MSCQGVELHVGVSSLLTISGLKLDENKSCQMLQNSLLSKIQGILRKY